MHIALSGRSRCAVTGERIPQGAIRIERKPRQGHPRHLSEAGLVHLAAQSERWRKHLRARTAASAALLPTQDEQQKAAALTSPAMVAHMRAQYRPPIQRPLQCPWNCNRCGKEYKRLGAAAKHAADDKCTRRIVQRTPNPASSPGQAPAAMRDRRQRRVTFRSVVQLEAEEAEYIPTQQVHGCADCSARQAGACRRCQLWRWMTLARDKKAWAKLIYEIEDDDRSHTATNRGETWLAAAGEWDPPWPHMVPPQVHGPPNANVDGRRRRRPMPARRATASQGTRTVQAVSS